MEANPNPNPDPNPNAGRMEVVWKSSMGEAGRLQSNTVQRKLPVVRGVEIHLISAPSEVHLETPFEIVISVANTSASEMQLQLMASTMLPPAPAAIVVEGVCTRNLGTFRPNSSQSVTIRMLAIETGMHRVTGLQLIDVLTEQVREHAPTRLDCDYNHILQNFVWTPWCA